MSPLFDLSKVKALIDEKRLSAAIIIDTDIVIREPDFTRWKSSVDKPLYVLPCTMNLELEHLKNKPDSKEDAHQARKNVSVLCQEGRIFDGIYKKGIGYFISIPLPERGALESELEQLESLVKAFGQTDTELVILAKEMAQAIPHIPVIFAAVDRHLFAAVKFIGINSYLFNDFPIQGIGKSASQVVTGAMNWDEILTDIQADAEKKLVKVEITLASKGAVPKWIATMNDTINKRPVIVAEGTGVIHGITDIRFTWALPFEHWDFPSTEITVADANNPLSEAKQSGTNVDKLHAGTTRLDFGGLEQSVSPSLRAALTQKMNNCASPLAFIEDMPTLQDPVAVMKQFFLFEYVFEDREFHAELPQESLEEFEKKIKNYNNLLNWAYYWLYDRKTTKDERNISFGEFLHAMRSCWSIGDTLKIELMNDAAELTNLQGEAEE